MGVPPPGLRNPQPQVSALPILGGSWVAISEVISRVTVVITRIRGLMTPLLTTHEPPSRAQKSATPVRALPLPAARQPSRAVSERCVVLHQAEHCSAACFRERPM